jgi:hypothetical protein
VEILRGANKVTTFIRRFSPYAAYLWRGAGAKKEIIPGSEEENEQALRELEVMMEVGDLWAAAKNTAVWDPESVPEAPTEEGALSMFRLQEQPYTEVEAGDDLEDIAVVYAGQSQRELAFEMAEIEQDEDPRYLPDEQQADLSLAEALVGDDPN